MSSSLKFIPILLALAIYFIRMKEVGTRREVVKGPVQEKTTFRLFMVSGIIVIVGGLFEYVWKGFNPNWFLVTLGLLLGVGSFVIRRATITALGKFWSLHIEIRENHQFIQSGPFRWMRHPTYFSMILELLSVLLILGAFYSGILAFFIFIPALARRISAEEKAMVDKFGDQYRNYQKGTPILFPTKVP